MADLEAVLADVSYLMAMEKSKSTPAARASKKIVLPDPRYVHSQNQPRTSQIHGDLEPETLTASAHYKSRMPVHYYEFMSLPTLYALMLHIPIFSVRSVMHKHLEKMGEVTFDKIFNQKLGKCSLTNT